LLISPRWATCQAVKVEHKQHILGRLGFVLGGDPGDEDASDFILAGAREGELVATDSIGVVVPTRIMADCHDIAAKFEGWQAEATIVRVCDDSREIALFETKTAEPVPSYFHRHLLHRSRL
jgi:hypothetical protein